MNGTVSHTIAAGVDGRAQKSSTSISIAMQPVPVAGVLIPSLEHC